MYLNTNSTLENVASTRITIFDLKLW